MSVRPKLSVDMSDEERTRYKITALQKGFSSLSEYVRSLLEAGERHDRTTKESE